MAQFYFDVNDEELGANLPSFLRLTTNSTSAVENNIEERERPEGTIGKVWRYDPKINNTGYGLILHAVPKQAGTKEVLLLCKLSTNSSNNYLILRPAPRLDEITANKPDWIHAGLRPGDSQVRVRSEVHGVLSSHATSEKTGWNYDFASTHWFWQRTRITADGVVSTKVWEHGTAEPAVWDLQHTDSGNRLEESYLGLSSRNSVEMLVAKVSAATEGDSAPTEPVVTTQSITSDIELIFNIQQALTAELDINYDLRESMQADLQSTWDMLNAIHMDVGATWSIIQNLTADLQADWQIVQNVDIDVELPWSIESAIQTAIKDLNASWHIRHAVVASLNTQWELLAALEIDLQSRWSIAESIITDMQLLFAQRQQVMQSATLTWHQISIAENSITFTWKLGDTVLPPISIIKIRPETRVFRAVIH